MKRREKIIAIVVLIMYAAILFSCKKDDVNPKSASTDIKGKWLLTEFQLYDGPEDVSGDNITWEFETDSVLFVRTGNGTSVNVYEWTWEIDNTTLYVERPGYYFNYELLLLNSNDLIIEYGNGTENYMYRRFVKQ